MFILMQDAGIRFDTTNENPTTNVQQSGKFKYQPLLRKGITSLYALADVEGA